MATKYFPLFLVFLSAHGFLLDKTQSTSGQSGTSNQYVTASEFFDETKARHLEDQQLRRYVDKALAVLTSQLEHKFDALDQKFLRGENQSVSSQVYESLEQKYTDLERKYTDLEHKYKSVNNEFNLIKSHFLSVQNKTSENRNDIHTLKQLGNIKPLQEIQTLQQDLKSVSAQTHSLTVNERARSQDFLALYNITINQKSALSVLNATSREQLMKLRELETNNSKQLLRLGQFETNTSKQLLRLGELETNTSKQLLRLEQNHNSTTAGIISKMESMEKQVNKSMSVIQKQTNENAERVAMTAHPSHAGTISNNIMKFNDVKFSVGVTNLATYKSTGKFTCEQEGLYILSASVMSHTSNAYYHISLNGNYISETYIGQHSSSYAQTGAVTVIHNLNQNDQVWLIPSGSWYLYGG
ncbi:unnamed protein product [Mytilus edulis]|uniref:C1q domain-containing protein n=1 Tax=Mytilus edulis TaxID=6550 RepID=A0A8S3UQJ8_MYTED|nr:unnamed protein product [Mytilus edulis]